jgi:hypothetical protein
VCVVPVTPADLHACLDGLQGGGPDGAMLTGVAEGAALAELVRARHRLDAVIESRLARFDARGLAEADGVASTAAWLRGKTRMAGAEASGRVKTARLLGDLPETTAALERGEISLDHARVIAGLAKDTDLAATQRVEAGLVEVAKLVDPVRFSAELAVIRDAYRKDGTGEKDSDDTDKRRLSIAASLSGMFSVGGWLPAESGALVKTAIDAFAKPKPGDTRTPAQRRADALVEVIRLGLAAAGVPSQHGVRPTLLVTTTVQPDPATPAEPVRPGPAAADVNGNCADNTCPADAPIGLRFGPGVVPGGGLISRTTVERLACDATVRRIIFGPDGEVLDLGRAARTVTPAQWMALVTRDGGCVLPHHDCPPAHCQAHHWKRPWVEGGETNVADMALTCTWGHTLVHEGRARLFLDEDQRWTLRLADGTVIRGLKLGQTALGRAGPIASAADKPPDPEEPRGP